VAIDFSEAMLAKARALHPGIDFRLGDAEQLPFDAATFDALAMSFGLLHLGDPERALREAQRVLARGGRFGFTVWPGPDLARAFRVVLDAVARHGATNVDLPKGPDFFFYGDPANARRRSSGSRPTCARRHGPSRARTAGSRSRCRRASPGPRSPESAATAPAA
jgi:SAM-dependent methyltransferase